MKDREIFSRLTTTLPFILRLDGRAFHTFTSAYEKPFDDRFSECFVKTAESLFSASGLSPDFVYTFSDEISLFISKPLFDCRVEKLVSVAAAHAASAFTLYSGAESPVSFDARVVPIDRGQLSAYLAWRQAEAWRNHINGYCQKLLTDSGLSATQAQRKLDGMNAGALHELAFSQGINLGTTPAWQRRGIAVYRGTVEKMGYNPKTGESAPVTRNVAVIDRDLPLFKTPAGQKWVVEKLLLPTDI